ncbi:unnamed protein product [Vitrella brassicaformis CCMP3155]|uniref:Uncharacterized protein n=1 Tax=Vitrella brassicaformis (strain CCMP3155) TaxID=1169540 RepID=A0A0G4F252_VITBC|nr:unnamed protein product [Vitrella brassicaformis CCMP3155]|eukprot:CEM05700.1 unnamed protein product [Vitrella brassicaformis CCMP3155]
MDGRRTAMRNGQQPNHTYARRTGARAAMNVSSNCGIPTTNSSSTPTTAASPQEAPSSPAAPIARTPERPGTPEPHTPEAPRPRRPLLECVEESDDESDNGEGGGSGEPPRKRLRVLCDIVEGSLVACVHPNGGFALIEEEAYGFQDVLMFPEGVSEWGVVDGTVLDEEGYVVRLPEATLSHMRDLYGTAMTTCVAQVRSVGGVVTSE